MVLFKFVVFLTILCISQQDETIKPGDPRSHHLPIETHHSLRFPFDTSIQHWHYGGHAVATTDMIRLTPNIQSRSGWLFNEFDMQSDNWEMEVKFAAWSTYHIGGDGMGIWILNSTMHPSNSAPDDWTWLTGPLFGLKSAFDGVGIVIDTYDNDGMRDNPRIFVLRNDGKKEVWNHDNDFKTDMVQPAEGAAPDSNSCSFEIRQRGKFWTTHLQRMLIRYINEVLHVYIDTERRTNDNLAEYKFCLSVPLPGLKTKGHGHIAATALTGQVADIHDIHQITLRYLDASDDVIDDKTLESKWTGTAQVGMFGIFLNLINFILLGYLAYDIFFNQIRQFHKIAREQINHHYVCGQINKTADLLYGLYFAQFIIFLLLDDWNFAFLNAPLVALRVYRYMTDAHTVHAKELSKINKWGINRLTISYFECIWFIVLMVCCGRKVLGV